jgi:hypothetical protein
MSFQKRQAADFMSWKDIGLCSLMMYARADQSKQLDTITILHLTSFGKAVLAIPDSLPQAMHQ